MEDENKLMQEKIIELDNELADYDHILEEFNKVRDKMGSYMFKELVDNIPGQKWKIYKFFFIITAPYVFIKLYILYYIIN